MKMSESQDSELKITNLLKSLDQRLSKIETKLVEACESRIQKEWYTVPEAAEILGKAPFTVREWARLDRINAMKRPSGRGKASEWMISHKELERIQNKGLLPPNL